MSREEVAAKTVVLQVFDWDLITGDDDIGEVQVISLHYCANGPQSQSQ